MDLHLKGKTAVVTGGSKGIGAGICKVLASEGVNIIFTYGHNDEKAQELCETLIKEYGVGVLPLKMDVTLYESAEKTYELGIEKFGRIDFLINNAGGGKGSVSTPFAGMDVNVWKGVQDLTLNSAFYMSSVFAGKWIENGQKACIVNVLSKSGFYSKTRGNSAYASAKAGLNGLTRAMANELMPHGIRVNGVIPGYVETEKLYQPGSSSYEHVINNLITGRCAKPEDIANVVCFLCSDRSEQIVGAAIDVTGGCLL